MGSRKASRWPHEWGVCGVLTLCWTGSDSLLCPLASPGPPCHALGDLWRRGLQYNALFGRLKSSVLTIYSSDWRGVVPGWEGKAGLRLTHGGEPR